MKKGKETVDLSQLPSVSETITSLIFKFETTDKKLKNNRILLQNSRKRIKNDFS